MPKALYLGTSQFSEMMNTERWQLTNGMKKEGCYRFYDLKHRDENSIDLYKLWIQENTPDFIVLEDYDWAWKLKLPLEYTNTEKIPVPIWGFIADYWYDPKEKLGYYKRNNISGLIAIHEAANEYIKKEFSGQIKKIINIPFSIQEDDFSKNPREKEYDILCSGFMGDLYPLRQRVSEILKGTTRVNAHFLGHPGYWKNNEGIGVQGRNYYTLMEKAKFVLSTTGIYNISTRKHIEAVGSRSKILGNISGFQEHEVFNDFTLMLNQEMTDKQIIKTIEQGVENWEWSTVEENQRQLVLAIHDPLSIAKTLMQKLEQNHRHE